jgi:phage shock protein PspC (stress-responsive transcriptional regulator)
MMNIDYTLEESTVPSKNSIPQPDETAQKSEVNFERITTVEESPDAEGSKTSKPKPTLYRSPTDKMVGGVCGGLADFFGWDASLIRLFWVVMTLATGGGGFLAYLALWMMLPVGSVAGGQQAPAAISLTERNLIRGAYILIGLGVVWLLANIGVLGSLWGVFWTLVNLFFWPALLIGIGYMLLRGANRDLKVDFSDLRNKVQGNVNVNGKMPSSDEVKTGMSEVRQRIPLRRSETDRILLGVCGGIGQRLGIDSNLVRLIWAAFSIGSIGLGVLVYVAVGLILPEESPADVMEERTEAQDVNIVDGTINNTV